MNISYIRDARPTDATAICDIYNPYVLETTHTFEEMPVTESLMLERLKPCIERGRWFVYELDSKVVGYAYANEWKARSAYRFTVETSVYVAKEYVGKGIGRQLYTRLIEKLKADDIHAIIGGISLPNPASIALHESMGFKKVAHYNEIGFKKGIWLDVGYWQYEVSHV
jgi:phosphinothricin acetyltransferase